MFVTLNLEKGRRKVVRSGEEARSSEARRAKVRGPKGRGGGGVLGQGQLAPLPTSCRIWERGVSSSSRIRGKAPAEIDFCVF